MTRSSLRETGAVRALHFALLVIHWEKCLNLVPSGMSQCGNWVAASRQRPQAFRCDRGDESPHRFAIALSSGPWPGSDRAQPPAVVQNGFTLLELLVVVSIIGLLAAYVGPKYFSQIGRSEQSVARAQIEAFARALDTYRLNVGRMPTTEEGLAALVKAPSGADKWNGPYLSKAVPNDPWGRPYIYRMPGKQDDYDLLSYGRDGQPGGIDEAADISNH